jgi:hypothetical protein
MSTVAVAIICKTPAPGKSKTRLSPPLRPEECALKKAAKLVLGFADAQMDAEVAAGRMFEVNCDEQDLQE